MCAVPCGVGGRLSVHHHRDTTASPSKATFGALRGCERCSPHIAPAAPTCASCSYASLCLGMSWYVPRCCAEPHNVWFARRSGSLHAHPPCVLRYLNADSLSGTIPPETGNLSSLTELYNAPCAHCVAAPAHPAPAPRLPPTLVVARGTSFVHPSRHARFVAYPPTIGVA